MIAVEDEAIVVVEEKATPTKKRGRSTIRPLFFFLVVIVHHPIPRKIFQPSEIFFVRLSENFPPVEKIFPSVHPSKNFLTARLSENFPSIRPKISGRPSEDFPSETQYNEI